MEYRPLNLCGYTSCPIFLHVIVHDARGDVSYRVGDGLLCQGIDCSFRDSLSSRSCAALLFRFHKIRASQSFQRWKRAILSTKLHLARIMFGTQGCAEGLFHTAFLDLCCNIAACIRYWCSICMKDRYSICMCHGNSTCWLLAAARALIFS